MYGGYAWLTNAIAVDRAGHRLLLLGGMGGFLVLALTIPSDFDGAGRDLRAGLRLRRRAARGPLHPGALRVGRAGRSSRWRPRTSGRRSSCSRAASPAATPSAVALGRRRRPGVGRAARCAPSGASTIGAGRTSSSGTASSCIVALGESVVAVGIGAEGLPVDAALVGVALLGLALSALPVVDVLLRRRRTLAPALGGRRRRAPRAHTRCAPSATRHVALLLAIIVVSAAIRKHHRPAPATLLDLAVAVGLARARGSAASCSAGRGASAASVGARRRRTGCGCGEHAGRRRLAITFGRRGGLERRARGARPRCSARPLGRGRSASLRRARRASASERRAPRGRGG